MRSLFLLAPLLSCSTEVGLMGYKNSPQDSSAEDITLDENVDSGSDSDTNSHIEDSAANVQNSGITGYVNYKLRQVACPACVGESQEITVTFSAKFHQPSSDGHTEWLPQVGSCTDNLYTISPSTVPISVGSSINVYNPSHSFSAQQTGNGIYQTSQIWESQYQRNDVYTVDTDLGSFDIVSSYGYDYIEPYTLLWVDPSYAYDTPIYRSSQNNFSWSPPHPDGIFIITIAVYSWDGSQFLGRVDCAGEDSGAMSIPGSYFQQFPSGSLAAVHLNRHKVQLSETDINNSFVETHTEWEVIGTGHIQ